MMKADRIVDLHCDSLTFAHDNGHSLISGKLHFSLDRLAPGRSWCQCMAIFVPDSLRGQNARDYFDSVYAFYLKALEDHRELLTPVWNLREVSSAWEKTPFASILTLEGGTPLMGDPGRVEEMYEKGVRMMNLTWNAANELCGGALSGGGFTPAGRETVRRMEKLGLAVDVSHLSDEGFWELCGFAEKPFLASHSNSRSLCNHPRNLTDGMFREIAARRGLVGLNYYKSFIVEDGITADISDLVRHALHFLELGGEDIVALGSDFDGAEVPDYIRGIERVDHLITALRRAGVPEHIVEKMLWKNAIRFFEEVQ